jgi:small neutral amino acid transporter SnatA (MarC family)
VISLGGRKRLATPIINVIFQYSRETRRLLARRIASVSFIRLVVSFTIGSHLLSFFGISRSVVQVGAG